MAMKAYGASSVIQADPTRVWSILTDGAGWSSWDSGVDKVEGRIAQGETITIRSKVAAGRAFPVKVTTFEPGRTLVFSGGMPLGLFKHVRERREAAGGILTAWRGAPIRKLAPIPVDLPDGVGASTVVAPPGVCSGPARHAKYRPRPPGPFVAFQAERGVSG
jgi:polyketide cyclase/dehydrase/lipid transport protein